MLLCDLLKGESREQHPVDWHDRALLCAIALCGFRVFRAWLLTNFCVLDGQGEILEEGRVRTTPEGFARRFAAIEPCRMVMEVGTHSRWASKLLADIGHEVIVANPWKVRLIASSIKKTDRSDAETLARLGRIDPKLLSPVIHRGDAAQADLAIIHARESLIASRRLLINHVRGAVKPFGARLPSCDAARRLAVLLHRLWVAGEVYVPLKCEEVAA
ncbi:MAG TPA: transposase [Candidatus Tectomicrobia bacterium]